MRMTLWLMTVYHYNMFGCEKMSVVLEILCEQKCDGQLDTKTHDKVNLSLCFDVIACGLH